ncbi:MAG: dihydroorotase [Micavibrio aeruginosavorus]|uniref:Dihydroorotase n=1 Tax=Micavibrio aeruginosavorus TaxID=349221 RepID=A0A7T5R2C6_9BACT|nr:MAG: dihydroorotase [Micavibrio aeruginosavorus]
MAETFDLILRGGTAVLPGMTLEVDIGVRDGKIAAIGDLEGAAADNVIPCRGLHILPGVIDTQVHFREPGATHKEDIEHGTMAAAAGGVTAVFEMPNTTPLTTTPETLAQKMDIASQTAYCDYAFYLGGTAINARNLPEWENLPGVCGIKIFMGSSTGDLLSATDDEVRTVLANGHRVVAVHAEDEMMMNENKKTILGDSNNVNLHPAWRSPESCVSATNRLLRIARDCGRRVHVLHISTAEELDILAQNRDIATCEVLPNHLTLAAPECYERLGTRAQQNPPIRERRHQDALWQAVRNGLIDILGSDHAPHTLEEKGKTYPASPSGTPGVQTLVPVMLNHVNEGRLTLERFVDLTAYGPARIHQIAGKGRICPGYDADFTIVDMKARKEITAKQQKSKAGWSPYEGMKVTGWPVATIIRGQIVMQDGEVSGLPRGLPVRFKETLAGESAAATIVPLTRNRQQSA